MNKLQHYEKITLNDIQDLEEILLKNQAFLFEYFTKHFKYDFLLQRKKSNKIVIVFHGAKDQSVISPPYFERWSWMDVFNCNLLNISDPTLQISKSLKLGWYLGNREEYALEVIISVVLKIANNLGIKNNNIIFWGSSGGGFTSLMAAAKVNGSTGVAFNPQIDTSKYYSGHVKESLLASYGVSSIKQLDPSHWSKLSFIKQFYNKGSKDSQFIVCQNEADNFHLEKHYTELFNFITSYDVKNVFVTTYNSSRGHAAEDKELAKYIIGITNNNLDSLNDLYVHKRYKEFFNLAYLAANYTLSNGFKVSPDFLLRTLRSFSGIVKPSNNETIAYEALATLSITLYPRGHNIKNNYAKYLYNTGKVNDALMLYRELKEQLKDSLDDLSKENMEVLESARAFYDSCLQKIRSLSTNSALTNDPGLFRFGFLIAEDLNNVSSILNGWKSSSVGTFNLIRHPECKEYRYYSNNDEIVILGDFFVAHGDKSVEGICQSYIESCSLRVFDDLSGRFSIILKRSADVYVLGDAFGARTLYYSTNSSAVSSHVVLLAKALTSALDEKVCLYLKQKEFRLRGTFFLPGDITLFEGIHGLAPNNFYSLLGKKANRYFSGEVDNKFNVDFFKRIDEYFKNFSKWLIDNKITPVLGLTAGVDSRAVIAALSHYGVKLKLVTWDRINDDEKVVIEEMKRHLSKHSHSYIPTVLDKTADNSLKQKTVLAEFNSGFWRNRSDLTASMSELYTNNEIFIRGLGGEICRGFYNRHGNKATTINAELLSTIYLTKKIKNPSEFFNSATLAYSGGYIDRSSTVLNSSECDVLDLVYWEQRMGMWAANLLNEMDPALQDFVGINSRRVYASAFLLDNKERLGKEILVKVCSLYDDNLANIKVLS